MKALVAAVVLGLSLNAFATTQTYKVKGMHCSSCAESIKKEVCKIEGLQKCEVTVGEIVIEPKAGVTITDEQIKTATLKAGEYEVTPATAAAAKKGK